MPFNISSFKHNGLVYGGARPSQFNVFLTVPQTIGVAQTSIDKFRFVCRTAEIPQSEVGSIDIFYFGRAIRVAGDRSFGTWSVTVMNDEDFAVRALFETWSNGINRMVANVRDLTLDAEQYKTDLEVVQYGKDGTVLRSYGIVGAFPTIVSNIGLDWQTQNNIEEFSVTFAYDYWIPVIEQSSKLAGGVNVYGGQANTDGPLGPN